MKARLYFDGASSPHKKNKASWGYVLDIEGRERIESQGEVDDKYQQTNNVAEWLGLGHGLRRATLEGVTDLEIFGDSQLVLRQLTGEYKVKKEHLKVFHAAAISILSKIPKWTATWVDGYSNPADDVSRTGASEGIHRTKKTKTGIRDV